MFMFRSAILALSTERFFFVKAFGVGNAFGFTTESYFFEGIRSKAGFAIDLYHTLLKL